MTVSEELQMLLLKFPEIDEFDFEQLSPYVMQFYIQAYNNGNQTNQSDRPKKPEAEDDHELRYLSKRFILIENKLGVATEYVANLFKENQKVIKEFRKLYQPYAHDYELRYILDKKVFTLVWGGRDK